MKIIIMYQIKKYHLAWNACGKKKDKNEKNNWILSCQSTFNSSTIMIT